MRGLLQEDSFMTWLMTNFELSRSAELDGDAQSVDEGLVFRDIV